MAALYFAHRISSTILSFPNSSSTSRLSCLIFLLDDNGSSSSPSMGVVWLRDNLFLLRSNLAGTSNPGAVWSTVSSWSAISSCSRFAFSARILLRRSLLSVTAWATISSAARFCLRVSLPGTFKSSAAWMTFLSLSSFSFSSAAHFIIFEAERLRFRLNMLASFKSSTAWATIFSASSLSASSFNLLACRFSLLLGLGPSSFPTFSGSTNATRFRSNAATGVLPFLSAICSAVILAGNTSADLVLLRWPLPISCAAFPINSSMLSSW